MRLIAISIGVLATAAGAHTASIANEEHPVFSHMIILEVDQFYKGNLNKNIFENTLWAERSNSDKNTYEFYSTRPLHALGRGSGCGGHGCNLTKGELAGSLSIKFIKNLGRERLYSVANATGDLKIIENRLCVLREQGLSTFSCSVQTPLRTSDHGRDEVPPFYTFRFSATP